MSCETPEEQAEGRRRKKREAEVGKGKVVTLKVLYSLST